MSKLSVEYTLLNLEIDNCARLLKMLPIYSEEYRNVLEQEIEIRKKLNKTMIALMKES